MKIPDLKIPKNPNFSCGPTRKPEGWNVRNLNKKILEGIIEPVMWLNISSKL